MWRRSNFPRSKVILNLSTGDESFGFNYIVNAILILNINIHSQFLFGTEQLQGGLHMSHTGHTWSEITTIAQCHLWKFWLLFHWGMETVYFPSMQCPVAFISSGIKSWDKPTCPSSGLALWWWSVCLHVCWFCLEIKAFDSKKITLLHLIVNLIDSLLPSCSVVPFSEFTRVTSL